MTTRHHQGRLTTAIIFSLVIHIVSTIYIPSFVETYSLPDFKEEIIEIKRIKPPKKKEVTVKRKEPKKEKVMTKVAKKESLTIPSSVEKVIDGKINEIKLGEKFTPPPPLVSLPETIKEPSLIKSPVTFKKYMPPDSIKKFDPDGSALIGNIFGKKKNLPLPKIKTETKFLIKKAMISDNYKAGKEKIIGKEPKIKIRERNLKLGLKGEIIDRSIENRPDLPSANIDVETAIVLDFEVLPDGTIIKIKPQKRIDVNLERVAINYLKKWKFSNLPLEAAQKNQKGTLVVKFELE